MEFFLPQVALWSNVLMIGVPVFVSCARTHTLRTVLRYSAAQQLVAVMLRDMQQVTSKGREEEE